MNIRKGHQSDLDEIMVVYAKAKKFMDATGNRSQWNHGYPSRELIAEDIAKGQCYVCEENGIHGVFALIFGEDPTYGYIEGGAWENDRPYATIHRIGSDGEIKGIFTTAIDYCKSLSDELRIDTHEKNAIMRHLIIKNGFKQRGIIYIADGTPRIAFQYSAPRP